MNVSKLVESFFIDAQVDSGEIKNEHALQFEIGCLFRRKSYSLSFEYPLKVPRHPSSTKRQKTNLDLFVERRGENTAIELKLPLSGRVPETMYDFCADISFLEMIVKHRKAKKGLAVMATNNSNFWSGHLEDGIYPYFRNSKKLSGKIEKPTGDSKTTVFIEGNYVLKWKNVKNLLMLGDSKPENSKFLVVEVRC